MDPLTLFEPEFARRALAATLLLSVAGGLIGVTVVLRDLPFFVHGVGAGAFPALVLGALWAVPALIAGFTGAAVLALLLWLTTRGPGADARVRDTRTGLLVAASLAAGAVLAGKLGAGAGLALTPESMLFGSVLTATPATIAVAAATAVVTIAVVRLRAEHWLATGFDIGAARGIGVARGDLSMLLTAALVTAAALPFTGALMAGALIVIPAAAARTLSRRAATMTWLSPLLAAVAGVSGLYLSLAFDLPTGAAIAVAAGGVFALAATFTALKSRPLRSVAAAGMLLGVAALAGCGSNTGGEKPEENDRIPVVATTTQAADLARSIGGGHVNVTALLKPGADPHEYEPTPSDVAALAEARVIFEHGGEIDEWLQPAIDAGGGGRKPVDLSNGAVLLPPGLPGSTEAGASADRSSNRQNNGTTEEPFNAHWSLSPDNLRSVALLVRDELIKADPKHRETYRAQTAAYRAKVAASDKRLRTCVETTRDSNRSIVAGHDDFIYLTEHFGFTTTALLRSGGNAEPSAADVEQATAAARAGDARAMLVSRGEAGRLDKAVASRLRIPLLELYGDSLARSGDPADTALGAIESNTARIVEAVGGVARACVG